jgi:hypothetical protein
LSFCLQCNWATWFVSIFFHYIFNSFHIALQRITIFLFQVYCSRLSTLFISSNSIPSNISFTKSWFNLDHFFNSCWNAYSSFTKDHFQYPAYIWVVSTGQSFSIHLFNEVFIKCHIITQIDTTYFLIALS